MVKYSCLVNSALGCGHIVLLCHYTLIEFGGLPIGLSSLWVDHP